jgi:hypothetical protein
MQAYRSVAASGFILVLKEFWAWIRPTLAGEEVFLDGGLNEIGCHWQVVTKNRHREIRFRRRQSDLHLLFDILLLFGGALFKGGLPHRCPCHRRYQGKRSKDQERDADDVLHFGTSGFGR